ncbi:hypothetical protein D3C81_1931970 [compost metagenome]
MILAGSVSAGLSAIARFVSAVKLLWVWEYVPVPVVKPTIYPKTVTFSIAVLAKAASTVIGASAEAIPVPGEIPGKPPVNSSTNTRRRLSVFLPCEDNFM